MYCFVDALRDLDVRRLQVRLLLLLLLLLLLQELQKFSDIIFRPIQPF